MKMLSLRLQSNVPLAIDLKRGFIQKRNFKFEKEILFSSLTLLNWLKSKEQTLK